MSTPDANGWMPIETAPFEQDAVIVGVWVGERWASWIAENCEFFGFGCDGECGDEPTHWQRPPAPPVA